MSSQKGKITGKYMDKYLLKSLLFKILDKKIYNLKNMLILKSPFLKKKKIPWYKMETFCISELPFHLMQNISKE